MGPFRAVIECHNPLDHDLVRWAQRKYKKLRGRNMRVWGQAARVAPTCADVPPALVPGDHADWTIGDG